MSTNKSISCILCNKGIIVNLYKLHFPSFPFSLQPNKRVFHPPTFPPLQPSNQTHEGKLNISSYFSTPSTKQTLSIEEKKKMSDFLNVDLYPDLNIIYKKPSTHPGHLTGELSEERGQVYENNVFFF